MDNVLTDVADMDTSPTFSELKTCTIKEVLRTSISIGEFYSLGRDFPDISLHYIFCAFDSFAHTEYCPCEDVKRCEECLYRKGNKKSADDIYMYRAFSAAGIADVLTQRFLVIEYENQIRMIKKLVHVPKRVWRKYVMLNASEEDKKTINEYNEAYNKHINAREKLRDFLKENGCSTSATDISLFMDDMEISGKMQLISYFRKYTSTARETYYAIQKVIPIRQVAKSEYIKTHPVLSKIEWTVFVAGVAYAVVMAILKFLF